MKVWLEVPDSLTEQIAGRGRNVPRAALEALVAEAYRALRLTGVEVCQLLDIPSRNDLDAFLKSHGVLLDYTKPSRPSSGQYTENQKSSVCFAK